MTIKIAEGAQISRLASAVINNAIKDFLFGLPQDQVTALEFLCSPDLILWVDAADTSIDINQLLLNPQRGRDALKEQGIGRKEKKQTGANNE